VSIDTAQAASWHDQEKQLGTAFMGPETAASPTRNYFMGKGQLPQKGQ
jgi:hypothetical protein